jgi:hypothetical protein
MNSNSELEKLNKNKKNQIEIERKPSSLASRIKTAIICLPILFMMLYFKFLYTILMLLVIYFGHSEFHDLQKNILSKLINDYYSEILWLTLMSSPLPTLFFMLCPIILYLFKNSELFAFIIPLSVLFIHRIKNFMILHRVLNTSEASFTSRSGNDEGKVFYNSDEMIRKLSQNDKMPNPIRTALIKEHLDDSKHLKDEIKSHLEYNKAKGIFGFLNKLVKNTLSNVEKKEKIKNDENNQYQYSQQNKIPNKENSSNIVNQVVSTSMFNCCLIIIMLDVIYFIFYVYAVCLGISVHNFEHAFIWLLMVVVIAYQCDNGALFVGKYFGKRPFGNPITPSKTVEGVYGGIIWG